MHTIPTGLHSATTSTQKSCWGCIEADLDSVRKDLRVSFHQGCVERPTADNNRLDNGQAKKTVDSWISIIYEALRNGQPQKPLRA